MQGIKNYTKKEKKNATIMGDVIKRYRLIYLSILILISLFEVGMITYMSIRLTQRVTPYRLIYLCSYVVLLLASVLTAIVVALCKKKNISPIKLSILLHVYVVLIVVWATVISSLDVLDGSYPIVFLTILMAIGGFVFIDPILYTILGVLSTGAIFVATGISQHNNTIGYFFNITVFIVMAVVVAYRNYKVSVVEEENKKYFQKLSEYDALTGLKNENSYYKLVDSLCNKIKAGEKVNFSISMMDVNLLKSTNDKYGHQYGAHLIKTAGQAIGKIYSDSHVFHVGGDEFIVVSIADHKKVEEYVAKFDEELRYKPITFKGNDLILSVARGYASYEQGDLYADVLQRADNAMYEHKKQMKKELNIAER